MPAILPSHSKPLIKGTESGKKKKKRKKKESKSIKRNM